MTPPAPDAAQTVARARAAAALLASLVAILPLTGFAQAQPVGTAVPRVEATAAGESPAAGSKPSESPVFGLLRPDDGSVTPLPPGTSYKDFVEWIAAKRGPGYGINSVRLDAKPAADGRFEIEAEVRLVVLRKGEWVRVPLAFNEAVLLEVEHEGEGGYSFSRRPDEPGLAWSFDTAGEHTLRLTLLLAPQATSRMGETRLALTTPADAAVTTASLAIPSEADATAVTGVIRSAKASAGATNVEWAGPGGRVEFAWRPKPVAASLSDLTANTTIFPSVVRGAIQLRAIQRIAASKGQISSVKVLLPPGFAFGDVSGTLVASFKEVPQDGSAESGRAVTAELSEPTAGPFELTWKVTAPLPAEGAGTFTLAGFSLPGVPPAAQSGRVVVEQAAGYEIEQADPKASAGVRLLAMDADPSSLPVSSAYEFESQPFQMKLRARSVPPAYSVGRELLFRVAPEELSLDAKFAVQVTRGELRDLKLVWPAPGWTLASIRAANLTEVKKTSDPLAVELRLASPVASFSVPVRATLPRPGTGTTVSLPLPRLEPAGPADPPSYRETVLGFRHADDVTVELRAAAGTVRPLDPAESGAVANLSPPSVGERWTFFRASPEAADLTLEFRRAPRTVTADAAVTVTPDDDGFRVTEQINYRVENGTLAELRVNVPDGVEDLRFSDGDGSPLDTKPATDGAKSEVTLPLARTVTGPFTLTAEFRTDGRDADDGARAASMPLVTPLDAEPTTVTLQVSGAEAFDPAVESAAWVRQPPAEPDGDPRWVSSRFEGPIRLRLMPRRPAAAKLLLRSGVDREGAVQTSADWRLDQPPRRLAVRLGEGASLLTVHWRGRAVTPEPDADDRTFRLDLGTGRSAGVLHVETRAQTADLSGLAGRVSLPTVEFVGDDAVEVGETLWSVSLPETQHLFTSPAGYMPQSRWSLAGGLWNRQADDAFSEAEWLGADVGPAHGFEGGNRYAFARLGPPAPLAFTAISRSLVVLIGAGIAIVIGYAFAHGFVPRPRATLAALAAALLLLWAFFPNQVKIFLQPAAFGLLLVALAAFAERLLRGRQEPSAAEAPPSAVDFVTILPGGEGSTSAPPASAIGSEEPTVLRSGRPAPEPVGAYDSGPAT